MDGDAENREVQPSGADSAHDLFRNEQLPFPPLPAGLLPRLQPSGDAVFATAALSHGPYDLAHYVQSFEEETSPVDQAVIGFDGHGFNSWAVHCYIVHDGLALFIQLPWGGAFMDPEPVRAEIESVFAWATTLQAKMVQVRQAGSLPPDRWLEVVASRLSHAGWRWIDKRSESELPPWQPAGGMKARLLEELDRLLPGSDSAPPASA